MKPAAMIEKLPEYLACRDRVGEQYQLLELERQAERNKERPDDGGYTERYWKLKEHVQKLGQWSEQMDRLVAQARQAEYRREKRKRGVQ
jgi:hypothetical protein